MRTLVQFEYRKLWNKVSIVAVMAMCILSTLHTFIYLDMNSQWRSIDKNGEVVSGLASYRALKEASKEIEGTVDGRYLQDLKKQYESSADKQYLDEHRGFLGTGGMTKYMCPNYFINYAYYSYYMSNGNSKMGLDRKIAGIDTPVRVAYCQGISNFMNWYDLEYPVFFVVVAFALACTYAKDSLSGINELTLSAVCLARWYLQTLRCCCPACPETSCQGLFNTVHKIFKKSTQQKPGAKWLPACSCAAYSSAIIRRTSSRSIRLILSSIVSALVSLKCAHTR